MNSPSQYVTGREIARGGMGAVLDARDQKLGRKVAMKVMLRHHASEEKQQRFLQEARVLGQLAHPNIVPIHDLGTDQEGRLFYTMKLVQGVTLQEVLDRLKAGDPDALARHPLSSLLTIFQKVCDAVGFAHSRGIIHRDLKPQNIMVGEFGEVLVMDWGLAKVSSWSASTGTEAPRRRRPDWWSPFSPQSKRPWRRRRLARARPRAIQSAPSPSRGNGPGPPGNSRRKSPTPRRRTKWSWIPCVSAPSRS